WERVMPEMSELPYKGDTVVENDVWIGYQALIMPGVRIGNGAIVSARAVVTRDVPAYTIVGGNPAVPIRKRFPEEAIEKLQAVAWWNWPIEKITRHLHLIVGGDVEALAASA